MQPKEEDRYVMRGALGSELDRNTSLSTAKHQLKAQSTHERAPSRRHHHHQREHAIIFSAISPPARSLYVTKPFLFCVVEERWQRRCCQVMHATRRRRRRVASLRGRIRTDWRASWHKQQHFYLIWGGRGRLLLGCGISPLAVDANERNLGTTF